MTSERSLEIIVAHRPDGMALPEVARLLRYGDSPVLTWTRGCEKVAEDGAGMETPHVRREMLP